MGTTALFGFRYPALTDSPAVPTHIQNLAQDVEDRLNYTRYVRLAADVTKTSSTAMGDVTGLSFSLAASAEYGIDGYIPYYCLDGVDCRLAWTGPTGMTVSFSFLGSETTTTSPTGMGNWTSLEAVGDANYILLNTETDTSIHTIPRGYFKTGVTSGTLQLRFAQNVSNASPLTIRRGSWLRIYRLA
jgi:hypothetical protein